MIIINHRVNTIEKLLATPKEWGVEVDIRPFGKRIILQHEPFEDGIDFEKFLKHYNHSILILNVKSEGIEKEVLQLMHTFQIKKYFFLDVTFPFMVKYINKGVSQFAVRFSEYESIETCLSLKGKVEWVFIDNFTKLPIEQDAFTKLKKFFKLCIVSPELLHRDEVEETKRIVHTYDVDAVLTDHGEVWRE